MTLPLGHRIDGEFVCMDCVRPDDHRDGGIGSGVSAVYERVGSGLECSRCERRMPYLATVRLLPDGYSSLGAPKPEIFGPGRKMVRLEREEKVLIDNHALIYVSIGCQREVGIEVTPHGKVRVWVHDVDGEEPSAAWEHDPTTDQRGNATLGHGE
jgi:hypothetical protein